MKAHRKRRFFIALLIPLAIGAAAACAQHGMHLEPGAAFASDLLFAQGSAFLVWGIARLLGNMKMFASFTWSFKLFHKLIRGETVSSAKSRDAYLEYRNALPRRGGAALLLGIAALLLALSAAIAIAA